MSTLFDFDAYMCQLAGNAGKVARHKRLYGVLRLSIAKTGLPAFRGRVEAWALGPVFTDLQRRPNVGGNADALSSEERHLCETVLAKIGHLSGRALAVRSHRRYPEWRAARAGLRPIECGHREISPQTIREMTYDQLRVEGDRITFMPNHKPGLALRQLRDLVRQPNAGD